MGTIDLSTRFNAPRGNVRGRRTGVFALHRQLFRKGQRCGKVYDYLFPGETRAEGQKRLMLNVGTDRRRRRQVSRMNARMKRLREIFSGRGV